MTRNEQIKDLVVNGIACAITSVGMAALQPRFAVASYGMGAAVFIGKAAYNFWKANPSDNKTPQPSYKPPEV